MKKSPPKPPAFPPALLVALTKNLAKPEEALAAGEYPVHGQALLQVDAIVCVGEAGDAKATVSVDAGKLLAAYLHTCGLDLPPADELHKLLRKAFALSLVEKPKEPYLAMTAMVEVTLKRCRDEVAETRARVPRAGAVKAPGSCEVVEWRPQG